MTIHVPKWLLVVLGALYGLRQYADWESDRELVGRYCNHGAVSRAQYDGCVDHVTAEDVSRRYRRIDSGRWQESAPIYAVECDESPSDYTQRAIPPCYTSGDWEPYP